MKIHGVGGKIYLLIELHVVREVFSLWNVIKKGEKSSKSLYRMWSLYNS